MAPQSPVSKVQAGGTTPVTPVKLNSAGNNDDTDAAEKKKMMLSTTIQGMLNGSIVAYNPSNQNQGTQSVSTGIRA